MGPVLYFSLDVQGTSTSEGGVQRVNETRQRCPEEGRVGRSRLNGWTGQECLVVMPLFPDDRELFLFTGNYGSGKTEVSVNVATTLARAGVKPLTIAELDLVNPYFRCREARDPMEALGIRVVAPGGNMHNADLPILLPEVLGAIRNRDGVTLLDVGGDNVGATVLASLKPMLMNRPHHMLFVLNQNRPFTDTIDGVAGRQQRGGAECENGQNTLFHCHTPLTPSEIVRAPGNQPLEA